MPKLLKITTAQSGIVKAAPTMQNSFVFEYSKDTEEGTPTAGEMLETAASDISLENRLNRQRMDRFRTKFSVRFLQLLREQDFEYGIDTPADAFLRKCYAENESVSKEWLNQLFVENFNDVTVVLGVLRVLSHFEYMEVAPQGLTMALAALTHSNAEVRECGIRACENWGTLECLSVLKKVHCSESWLNDYLKLVIVDLEEELGRNAISR